MLLQAVDIDISNPRYNERSIYSPRTDLGVFNSIVDNYTDGPIVLDVPDVEHNHGSSTSDYRPPASSYQR